MQDEGIYRCFVDGREVSRYNLVVLSQNRHTRQQELWSNWSDFSSCSVSCGIGFRTRTRKCLLPLKNCNETNFEVKICQNRACDNRYKSPTVLEIGPESVEWNGKGFSPYKDEEYNENGISHCRKGFTLDIFNKRCVDINECRIRDKCPRGLRCHNTKGSFRCVTCPKGYMGINGRCLGNFFIMFI